MAKWSLKAPDRQGRLRTRQRAHRQGCHKCRSNRRRQDSLVVRLVEPRGQLGKQLVAGDACGCAEARTLCDRKPRLGCDLASHSKEEVPRMRPGVTCLTYTARACRNMIATTYTLVKLCYTRHKVPTTWAPAL
jgi:hypothetical protein